MVHRLVRQRRQFRRYDRVLDDIDPVALHSGKAGQVVGDAVRHGDDLGRARVKQRHQTIGEAQGGGRGRRNVHGNLIMLRQHHPRRPRRRKPCQQRRDVDMDESGHQHGRPFPAKIAAERQDAVDGPPRAQFDYPDGGRNFAGKGALAPDQHQIDGPALLRHAGGQPQHHVFGAAAVKVL